MALIDGDISNDLHISFPVDIDLQLSASSAPEKIAGLFVYDDLQFRLWRDFQVEMQSQWIAAGFPADLFLGIGLEQGTIGLMESDETRAHHFLGSAHGNAEKCSLVGLGIHIQLQRIRRSTQTDQACSKGLSVIERRIFGGGVQAKEFIGFDLHVQIEILQAVVCQLKFDRALAPQTRIPDGHFGHLDGTVRKAYGRDIL